MAKYDITKIFIGIFIMTLASKGVLATMSCFACVPDYDGSSQSVRDKASAVNNEIKKGKNDAESCKFFVAGGIDQINRANSKLKDSSCNRCVKVQYKKDKDSFVGRGCEKSNSNFAAILAATAGDENYSIHYCDNEEYCNAAPSHFTGSFLSMVISLVAFSLKRFM